jgi:hypothetical protein
MSAIAWQEGDRSVLVFRREWATAWPEGDRSVLKAVVQQSASVSRRPTERGQ